MYQNTKYLISGFALTPDPTSFLVHIERCVQTDLAENSIAELPSWVFRSRNCIWLASEGRSILQRALDGEAMKEELIKKCSPAAKVS